MKPQIFLVSVLCVAVVKCSFSSSVTNYLFGDQIDNRLPIIQDGLPIDTPEVQAAKAAHFAAYAKAKALADKNPSDGQYHHPQKKSKYTVIAYSADLEDNLANFHRSKRGSYEIKEDTFDNDVFHIPIINEKGVPVDTPEVEEARKQHLLAHYLNELGVSYRGGYSIYIPVIAPNGVPYDTPEVDLARTQHLAIHEKEKHNQH